MTDGWVEVGALDDVRDGRATRVAVDGDGVLLYRSGDELFAIGSRCTHQGAPLDRGVLRVAGSQRTVTCPAHGSMFSLDDGSVVRGPASRPVPAYDARVEGGLVQLRPRT
jgi:nitrite reductase/ring-hydroxylating ferredoxin subunit